MVNGAELPVVTDSDYVLNIADGELFTYYRFSHESPIKVKQGDAIIGVCKEIMDVLAYWEFDKQSNKTKQYIVEELLEQKKKDGSYIKFEVPYSYEEQESDEDDFSNLN